MRGIRHRWVYQIGACRAVCMKCGVAGSVIPPPAGSAIDPRRVRPDNDAKCIGQVPPSRRREIEAMLKIDGRKAP